MPHNLQVRYEDTDSFAELNPSLPQLLTMRAAVMERPVTFLFLTVHGVGPCGPKGEKIKQHHDELARNANYVMQNCLPDFADERHVCIDFRGIDWQQEVRENLQVAKTLEDLTPPTISGARSLINDRFVDVLLYNEQRPVLQGAVRRALNDTFLQYVAENPDKAARDVHVVILAHSLGSVICYDLLAAPPSPPSGAPGGLVFPVLSLYLLGSPLGMFLASRGHPVGGLSSPFPPGASGSTYLYNIMHANDPISYRFEPFVAPALATHPPVALPNWATRGANGRGALLATVGAAALATAGVTHAGIMGSVFAPLAGILTVAGGTCQAPRRNRKRLTDPLPSGPSPCSGRHDFKLQSDLTEALSSYTGMLAAHKVYWFSRDLMYFALTQALCGVLLPQGAQAGKVAGPPCALPPRPPSALTTRPGLLGCPSPLRMPPNARQSAREDVAALGRPRGALFEACLDCFSCPAPAPAPKRSHASSSSSPPPLPFHAASAASDPLGGSFITYAVEWEEVEEDVD